jgi:hypothetical protein
MIMLTEINGCAIYRNGHLCEGDQMHPSDPGTFLLWTRCQQHDVPARAARELGPQDRITCEVCRRFFH